MKATTYKQPEPLLSGIDTSGLTAENIAFLVRTAGIIKAQRQLEADACEARWRFLVDRLRRD